MDVCQVVFVRLLKNRHRLTDQYPSSLLYRIATNLSLNRIRDRRRRVEASEDALLEQIAATEDPEARSAARSVLDRLFGKHPESTRTLAVLHYLDGLTLEQVAETAGMSVSGVRKRLRALRQTLAAMEAR